MERTTEQRLDAIEAGVARLVARLERKECEEAELRGRILARKQEIMAELQAGWAERDAYLADAAARREAEKASRLKWWQLW
jgi:hypothetical protein